MKKILIILILGLILLCIFILFGKPFASIFNKDPVIITYIHQYLIISAMGYVFLGIFFINVSAFNALKKPYHSITANAVRFIVLYIPLAFIFSQFISLAGVFWGAAISSILAGIFIWLWLWYVVLKIEKLHVIPESE